MPAGSLVLDAGAGDSLYRSLFAAHRYESADFCQVNKTYAAQTYTCDLAKIPVEDRRYDLILLTQVLEHLADPASVLREMHRILRPGARLWLSAPLFYPEHEQPYDFYRYTQFGFAHLLQNAGFEVERCEWLEGYGATLAFQLSLASTTLPWRPRAYGRGWRAWLAALAAVAGRAVFPPLAWVFGRADLRHRLICVGHPKNYTVVARRRE